MKRRDFLRKSLMGAAAVSTVPILLGKDTVKKVPLKPTTNTEKLSLEEIMKECLVQDEEGNMAFRVITED